jgi:thioredoxin reductase (NADPH)
MVKNKFLGISIVLLFSANTYPFPFIKHFFGPSIPKLEEAYGKDNLVPVIIIGSGPAGLSAAIYTSRAKLPTIVLTGDEVGGQLAGVREIENWPAKKKSSGEKVMDDLTKQAEHFGAIISLDNAILLDLSHWPFDIETENGEKLKAMAIIVATGRIPKKLKVPGVKKYWGKGIGTCTICEAPFQKGNIVAVVGGGDTAADRALQLANYAKKVYMFVKEGALDANGTVQDYLKNTKNIQIMLNTEVKEIKGTDDEIKSIVIENNKTDDISELPISGLYFAIGYHPNSDLVKKWIKLGPKGFIKIKGETQETNIPGVFAAGDVSETYGKAGIATGSGIKAGIDTIEFLQNIGINQDEIRKLSGQFYKKRAMKEHTIPLIASLEQFNGTIKNNEYVVADFYADYCPTCKALLPHLKEIGAYYGNKIKIIKVDHDNSKNRRSL